MTQVRVFRFLTGKAYRVFDESLAMYQEIQKVARLLYFCASFLFILVPL